MALRQIEAAFDLLVSVPEAGHAVLRVSHSQQGD